MYGSSTSRGKTSVKTLRLSTTLMHEVFKSLTGGHPQGTPTFVNLRPATLARDTYSHDPRTPRGPDPCSHHLVQELPLCSGACSKERALELQATSHASSLDLSSRRTLWTFLATLRSVLREPAFVLPRDIKPRDNPITSPRASLSPRTARTVQCCWLRRSTRLLLHPRRELTLPSHLRLWLTPAVAHRPPKGSATFNQRSPRSSRCG